MPVELPKNLREWLKQPGAVLTQADRDFIDDATIYANHGVDYGFMQRVCEWLWQERVERGGLPAGSAWGPEYFNAEIARLTAALDKSLAFKNYVHSRLDAAGVTVDPESSHKAEGCRIGGRLDEVFAERDVLRAALASACEQVSEHAIDYHHVTPEAMLATWRELLRR